MGKLETEGTVDEALENLQKTKSLDKECRNMWCDQQAVGMYRENKYARGFAVCSDCLKILRA